MKDLANTLDSRRLPGTFLILLGLSLLVGTLMGRESPFGIKLVFYMIMILNTIMLMYLILLRNMTHGILLYLYTLIFLNLYWRIGIPGRLPDLDLPRMTFVFLWLVFLLEVAMGSRKLLPRTNIEAAMLAVICALLFSMLFIGELQIRLFLNGFCLPYAMFVLAKNAIRSRKDVDRLIYWFAVPLSVYFPMNHFFEHFKMRNLVFPRYILDPEIGGRAIHAGVRTIGVFLQPVATGMALISMFLLSLYGLSRLRGFWPKLMSWGLVAITPAAVFIILSRSVYMGFAFSMVILLAFSKKLKVYAFVILVGAALAVMANWSNVKSEDREAGGLATAHSAKGRLVLMSASFKMFADHPFFGVGFNEFAVHARPYVRQVRTTLLGVRESREGKHVSQHNHFLNMLTEVGLVGLVPELLMYAFLFRILYRARRIHDGAIDHDFVVVVWAVLAEYLTNAMFMEPRFYEFMNVLPLLLAGIIVGSYQRKQLGNSLSPN